MKTRKHNWNGVGLCLFEMVIGILLLIDPVGFTKGIFVATGAILIGVGLVSVIKYFKSEPMEAALGQYLMKGLVALLGGAFCIFHSSWFMVTFSAITVIYGVVVLLIGLSKIQLTVDMWRRKMKKWWFAAIDAVVAVICGVIIVNDPFPSTTVLWMFIGITLIAEAALDLVTLIVSVKKEQATEA